MVHLQQLDFGYHKSHLLFEALDLSISKGGIYGLLGRNGAGKSTLLKLLTGCLKPAGGTVKLFGEEAFDRDPEILQRVFLLPEQVYLPATSWQLLEKAYAGFYPNYDSKTFWQTLETFQVPTTSKLRKLSLGQKKKGLIAFALACNTELLVLDEPTNGLDIPSKAQFRSMLAQAASDERAIIVSTHQVRDLAGLIDPVLIVEAGKVIANVELEQISQLFSFELESSLTPPKDALHCERVPGGHYVIRPNTTGRYTEPDLEVFFNAVVMPNSPVRTALTSLSPNPETLPS